MNNALKVVINEFGAPENMQIVSMELPNPAAGEVQLRHTAIGFNFIDIYQRKGVYPLPLPTGSRPRSGWRGRNGGRGRHRI